MATPPAAHRRDIDLATMLAINSSLAIPDDELRMTFSRSSGPGGQNVNKVASKATLHFAIRTSPSLSEDVRQRFLERYASRITKAGDVGLLIGIVLLWRQAGTFDLTDMRAMVASGALPVAGLSVITFYHYPEFANLPVTMQHLGVMIWVFPAALLMQRIGRSIATLPLFPAMADSDVDRVCDAAKKVLS